MPGQFNPDQNPFEDIVSGQRGGMMAGQQPQPTHTMPGGQQMAGAQHPIPGSSQQQTAEQMGPKQLQEGQEGTGSKFLLGAIQNIQGYIQMTTDPRKIQMLRQLATVFVNLLAQEQQAATAELQGYTGDEEGGESEMGSMGMMGGMGGGMQ